MTPSPPEARPHSVHFSTAKHDWRTPPLVFEDLHAEFGFTVDAASSDQNALLSRHWTEADEPLLRSWAGERVFVNPPYSHVSRWMEKAWNEAATAELVVALVPSRTDTAWWHDYVMQANEIRFIRGRLKFSGTKFNAPFPSAIVVWRAWRVNPNPELVPA